jgi:carbonic anhydrase/acetyltransferase-like protein (isoleucine patch superfamily)
VFVGSGSSVGSGALVGSGASVGSGTFVGSMVASVLLRNPQLKVSSTMTESMDTSMCLRFI